MAADTITSKSSKHCCYESYQMDQILSLLDDQLACLTLKTIMLELSVPRFVARRLLDDVAHRVTSSGHAGGGMTYEVVRMVPKTGVDELGRKKVSMELVVANTASSTADDDDQERGTIFSIAPAAPPSEDAEADYEEDVHNCISIVSAAHEKAMADQREKVTEGAEAELFSIFDVLGAGLLLKQCNIDDGDYILPAPELCEENEDGKRVSIRRVKRGRDVSNLSNGSGGNIANGPSSKGGPGSKSRIVSKTTTTSFSATSAATKSKVTTAAAFFGSSNNKSSNGGNKKKSSTTEETSTARSSKGDNENLEHTDSSAKDEKVNKRVTENNSKSSVSGNADDFIGDTDEDEDFLQEEAARKKRNAAAARKAAREQMQNDQTKRRNLGSMKERRSCVDPEKRRRVLEDDDEEDADTEKDAGDVELKGLEKGEEVKEAKVGAMDAFAKKTSPSSSSEMGSKNKSDGNNNGGSKKRIKKLVEQTSVDENGYMRTEMVTVWEEVDDTNEVKSKSTSGTSALKKNAGMAKSGSGKASSSTAKKGGAKKQTGLMGFFAKK